MLTRRRVAVLLAALLIGIAAPAVALANPSVQPPPPPEEVAPPQGVKPPEGGVKGAVTPPKEAHTTVIETVMGSSLPFTGFPALIVLGTGVGLAAGGIALRRATKSKSD